MALLIDRLRTGKFEVPFTAPNGAISIKKEVVKILSSPDIVVVDASNVAEWFYAGNDQEFWDYRNDFPNTAPPWQMFWIECRRPSAIRSRDPIVENPDPEELPDKWGVMFAAERQDDGGWLLNAAGFMEVDRIRMGPLFDMAAEIDSDGHWVHHTEQRQISQVDANSPGWGFMVPVPATAPDEVIDAYMRSVNALILAPLMAISFAHCRNVGHAEIRPPKKVSRKHEKRHGFAPARHYVLQIGPQASVVDAQAASSGVGRIEALHIVRGHFKTYTEEAPLMGKHTGTYWWADHARGDARAGEVVKDYEVNP